MPLDSWIDAVSSLSVEQNEARLIEAAREGRAEEVARLLTEGVDPNAAWPGEDDHGAFLEELTPLMVAAASPRSNVQTVRALLDGGADLLAVSAGEVSALWYAAGGGTGYPSTESNLAELLPDHPYRNWGGGDVERLRLLLDAGADPNEFADNGRSAVGEACSVGDPARLALLIERGGSVWPAKKRDPYGIGVPLFQAAASGNVECVRLVLAQGFPADYSAGGKTALHKAASLPVAEALLAAGAKLATVAFGEDPLDHALDDGHLGIAELLVSQLPQGERQKTLDQKLIAQAGRRNVEAVRVLLRLGADASRADPDFGSALHYCCWVGDSSCDEPDPANTPRVIDLLVAAGADIGLRNRQGETPLHQAASGDWGAPSAVAALLSHGAEIDAVDKEDRTPLMIAADNGELGCVRLLLAAGADPDVRDRRRKNAKDHARDHLSTWRTIVKGPVGRFLGKSLLRALRWDQEQVRSMHADALRNAEEVVRLLESADQRTT